jgi:superfamily II DNA or RNA helicase
MTKCLTKLVENNDRNNIIINEAITCIENGYFPIILSDRVKHNEYLYDKITLLGYKAILLIGKTRKLTKWEEIQQDLSIQCIVANSKIAGEGLDLPRASAMILTCPSSNLMKLKQQLGRIRRVYNGKPIPIMIDICDNLATTSNEDGSTTYLLKYMAQKRFRFYKELKLEYNQR